MFNIHSDKENHRWVIEDREGNIYATRDWPQGKQEDSTGPDFQNLIILLKLANIGDAEMARCEKEIQRLQRRKAGFER